MTTDSQEKLMSNQDNLSHIDDSYFDYDHNLEDSSTKSWETCALLGIFGLSFFLGVGGHLYLIAKRCWNHEKERGFFLLSSMVADLILLCLVMPLIAVAMYKGEWPFGTFLCKTINYALVMALGMSALSLVVGGSELIMCRRNPSSRRSCYSGKGLVLFMWLGVALTCIPVAVYTSIHSHWDRGTERHFCHQPHEANVSLKLYMTAMFALFYVFPVGMSLLALLSTRKPLDAEQEPEKIAVSGRADDVDDPGVAEKLKKSLALTLILFAICRLPTHITQLAEVVMEPSSFSVHLALIAQALFFFNCGLNPIMQIVLRKISNREFIPLKPIADPENKN